MSDVSRETDFYTEKVAAQIEQKRAGRRKLVFHGGRLCSGCYVEPPRPGQGYCAKCHSKYESVRRKADREELKRLRAVHGEVHHG